MKMPHELKMMSFELKMMLTGSVLLVLSLIYDYLVVDFFKGLSVQSQDRHLFVSQLLYRGGFIVVLLAVCLKVIKQLRSEKK